MKRKLHQHGSGSYAGSPYQYGGMFRGTAPPPPFQYGGFLPAYAGASHQYGFGLGDVLRGVIRTVVPFIWPVAKEALKGFALETARNLDLRKPLGESMKGALMPGLKCGLGGLATELNRQRHEAEARGRQEHQQSGEGKRGQKRRRKHGGVYKAKKHKAKRRKLDIQSGGNVNF